MNKTQFFEHFEGQRGKQHLFAARSISQVNTTWHLFNGLSLEALLGEEHYDVQYLGEDAVEAKQKLAALLEPGATVATKSKKPAKGETE